ncbi:MAG: urease accessory protein UreD, partial [Muribaculaceae bacterium]|nr:urease accessory protein UreD [Muribaculaceae bacterium]
ATKLARRRANYSGLRQTIELAEGAYLEYLPEPVIPCADTRFISETDMRVHPSATVFYSEIFMGGRKYYGDGELFDYDILSVCTRGERPDGRQLFREKFIISPKSFPIRGIGTMHRFDIFANVLVMTPEENIEPLYDATPTFYNPDEGLAAGITRLPNSAGLLFKVLGMETGPVKSVVRDFCSKVRMRVKGRPIPAEFPWR